LIGRVSWAKRKEGLGGIHPKAGEKALRLAQEENYIKTNK
jgi:hypothetical protein